MLSDLCAEDLCAEDICEDRAGDRIDLADTSVLELGAGLGLAGLVAASRGAIVVQTDHDGAALEACAQMARLNAITGVSQVPGNWHDWRDDRHYDLIIGADIAYDGDSHQPLLAIFARNLAPGGMILLADPEREMQATFIARAHVAGWTVQRLVRHVDDLRPGTAGARIAVAILALTRA